MPEITLSKVLLLALLQPMMSAEKINYYGRRSSIEMSFSHSSAATILGLSWPQYIRTG
jgi:hypothetical protein